jgi:hypothetical protein
MMASINIDLEFFDNPKVMRLISRLGQRSIESLLRLWCHVGRYSPEGGRLGDLSEDELESLTVWTGDRGMFVSTLLELHFLHRDSQGLYVHDWLEHEGHLAMYKERGRKMANARWAGHRKRQSEISQSTTASRDPDENAASNAYSNAVSMKNDAASNAYSNAKAVQYITTTTTAGGETPSPADVQEAALSPEAADVWDYWIGARTRAGLKTLSQQDKPGAARWAAEILAGRIAMPDYRLAVDNLLADPEARVKYSLGGLLRRVDIWINRTPQATQASSSAPSPEDDSWVGQGLRLQAEALGADLASLR